MYPQSECLGKAGKIMGLINQQIQMNYIFIKQPCLQNYGREQLRQILSIDLWPVCSHKHILRKCSEWKILFTRVSVYVERHT